MKVRALWVPPAEKNFVLGEVYDLADGADWVSAGNAEPVDAKTKALPDPRPAPEPGAAEPAAA